MRSGRGLRGARTRGGGALWGVLALAGCGQPAPVDLIEVPAPQALEGCANEPADLKAELWVSGAQEPCEMTVADDGSVSGECVVTARQERTLTLDWYVDTTSPDGAPLRMVLAQAREVLDLREPGSEQVSVSFDEVSIRSCVDVTGDDKVDGEVDMPVDGVPFPVCDLDASCAAGDPDSCTNLGEVCAGTDPLAP